MNSCININKLDKKQVGLLLYSSLTLEPHSLVGHVAIALYELARRANFSLIHIEDPSFENESAFMNYSFISYPHVSSVDRGHPHASVSPRIFETDKIPRFPRTQHYGQRRHSLGFPIIFGSTNVSFVEQFAKLMTSEFEMSMMGELRFFLGFGIYFHN